MNETNTLGVSLVIAVIAYLVTALIAGSGRENCEKVSQELSYYKAAIKITLTEEQQEQIQNQVKMAQQLFENKKE